DNLRAALAWAQESGTGGAMLRLAGALWRFWWVRGHLSEGRRWLEAALLIAESTATPARAKVQHGAGNLALAQGDRARAVALYDAALESRRALGDRQGAAMLLNNLGFIAQAEGDYERALSLHEEALAVRRELGDKRGIALS